MPRMPRIQHWYLTNTSTTILSPIKHAVKNDSQAREKKGIEKPFDARTLRHAR
jgi:hypothetical protein